MSDIDSRCEGCPQVGLGKQYDRMNSQAQAGFMACVRWNDVLAVTT